jgi:hypothetical protein
MKQSIKVFKIFFVLAAFAFIPPKHNLVGRWIIYAPDNMNSHEYVDFKKDGTYDVVLPNGKTGEIGNYKLNDSIFLIKNIKAVCGDGYWGSYKLTFHGRDSVCFIVIEDSCTARREDIVGGNPGLKRFKEK